MLDLPRAPLMRRPTWADPRIPITLFLISFDVYAIRSPLFSRHLSQWIAGISVCVMLDVLLAYWREQKLLFPLSGFITSLGILLLCDSMFIWPYVFVATVSILSKHLIRVDGRHLFNPNNFGMVVGLLFLSPYMVSDPSRWGNSFKGLALIAALGAFAAYRGKRLLVSASYVATSLVGVWLRAWWSGVSPYVVLAPLTGAAFTLFTFYMITDPATSPSDPRRQALFGASVGALDGLFRLYQFLEAPFYALFIICGIAPTVSWAWARLRVFARGSQPSLGAA